MLWKRSKLEKSRISEIKLQKIEQTWDALRKQEIINLLL
jgi:hypothetical protein